MNTDLLEKHLELVMEANKTTNITRISSWEEGKLLHIQDSLLGLPEVNNAPSGKYADLGSGAGFPGIPLGIETGRETMLVDTVGKKVAILSDIINQLGVSNITAHKARIEEFALDHPREFSVITARALAQISVLMELAEPLLKIGGHLICYKANVSDEEFSHACDLAEKLGYFLKSDRIVGFAGFSRRFVVFEKNKKSQIKLPRKVSFAQKRPL